MWVKFQFRYFKIQVAPGEGNAIPLQTCPLNRCLKAIYNFFSSRLIINNLHVIFFALLLRECDVPKQTFPPYFQRICRLGVRRATAPALVERSYGRNDLYSGRLKKVIKSRVKVIKMDICVSFLCPFRSGTVRNEEEAAGEMRRARWQMAVCLRETRYCRTFLLSGLFI